MNCNDKDGPAKKIKLDSESDALNSITEQSRSTKARYNRMGCANNQSVQIFGSHNS